MTKKLAYLVNVYPGVSHTFIRREIGAMEELGFRVERFSIRRADPSAMIDPEDRAESQRTRYLLDGGLVGLLPSAIGSALTHPVRFLRAIRLAIKLGWRSDRGLLAHLVYLLEASRLKRWLDREQGEHLHAHFGTNPATVALLCRALGGPPFSFTVHGPDEFDGPKAIALGEKILRASFVVAISQFGRGQLYRWTTAEHWPKIHVIHCGVDRSLLNAPIVPIPAMARLVSVGRISAQKGHLLLIQALARLRDQGTCCELVLVGDGPMRADVERLVERLGLGPSVRITGFVDGETVRREIQEARALVLASLAEGLPVVLMEALALGRPVVCTNIAGIAELVQPGHCGWVVPSGSVEELAEALRAVLEMPVPELERMGQHGARRVAERHDVKIEGAKLAAILQNLENHQP